MTADELEDFLILRRIDPPVTHAERERSSERSIAALDVVREDGNDIEWISSEIMETANNRVSGTLCHFRADTESTLYAHADCAGLPVTDVFHRAEPVDGPDAP